MAQKISKRVQFKILWNEYFAPNQNFLAGICYIIVFVLLFCLSMRYGHPFDKILILFFVLPSFWVVPSLKQRFNRK